MELKDTLIRLFLSAICVICVNCGTLLDFSEMLPLGDSFQLQQANNAQWRPFTMFAQTAMPFMTTAVGNSQMGGRPPSIPQIPMKPKGATTYLMAPQGAGKYFHFPRLPISFVGFPKGPAHNSFFPLAGGGINNAILPKQIVPSGVKHPPNSLGVLQVKPNPGVPGPPPDKPLHDHAVGMVVQGPHLAESKYMGPAVDSKHHLPLNHLFVPVPVFDEAVGIPEGPPPHVFADILLVIDASPEMGHIDPAGMVVWNPGVWGFINEMIQTTPMGPDLNRVGVVVVSHGIDDLIPITHDKALLLESLHHLRPTFQGGCSQKGISTASSLFYQYGRPLAVKRAIVIGHGSAKCRYRNMAEVMYARKCGIDTVTVEFGQMLGPVPTGKYQSAWIVPGPKHLIDVVTPVSKRAYMTPIHGSWSMWSSWNMCSSSGTCSIGYQMRFRMCNSPAPNFGGRKCPGFPAETRMCHMTPCIDKTVGHWSPWSKFSSCSSPCGIGSQTRTRSCLTLAGTPSAMCKGKYVEMSECIVKDCPVHGGWSRWSAFGLCSRTCGAGVKLRARQCDSPMPAHGGNQCQGPSVEETFCEPGIHCPIHGGYGEWGLWSPCAASCGMGTQSRERFCNSPFPQFNGMPCKGESVMMQDCDAGIPCPVHGNWGPWTSFGACSETCGVGIRMRERFCDSPTPSFGGMACKGVIVEEDPCETDIMCPVHGHWSDWSSFGPCSSACGAGVMESVRECNNPLPLFGGLPCEGPNILKKPCVNEIPCPIDGGWSPWSKFKQCSVKCGLGVITRTRECSHPMPQYGGALCVGLNAEEQVCDTLVSCPVHGFWSHWVPWGPCSASCEGGVRQRIRVCDNPTPDFGGLECDGSPVSEEICETGIPCPIPGAWSPWSDPLPCPVKCGKGLTKRVRECNSPPPLHGGPDCVGPSFEVIECVAKIMCPIHGNWSPWGKWTACDRSCGEGMTVRNRLCSSPEPMYDGLPCKGISTEVKTCDSGIMCPVHGLWSHWTPWTQCSVPCGQGIVTRTRMCDAPPPVFGGHPCDGPKMEKDVCITGMACPIDGGWSPWGELSSCSVTCGAGFMTRLRNCNNPLPKHNGLPCVGPGMETLPCDTDVYCPVHGNWGPWSKPSVCSVKCGVGIMTRSRMCNDPSPMYGGAPCSGYHTEETQCDTGIYCPIHGGWSKWSEFTPCTVQCGVAIITRKRSCTEPAPNYGGKLCIGVDVEEKLCSTGVPCPVDGNWSPWTVYSACSVHCGDGFQQRRRECNNPAPMYGGATCSGLPLEKIVCETGIPCPIDGGWTKWSGFGKCSATCGVGIHTKVRECANPVPMFKGLDCVGPSVFEEPCITDIPCPVNGMWTPWTDWDACSVPCGTGIAKRVRQCSNPPPLYGGMLCQGVVMETMECDTGIYCPIHGGWGPWGKFSFCSVTCGVGVRQRDRACDLPLPQYGGNPCTGELLHTEVCDTGIPCPVDGMFSLWSKWSLCSASCGKGVQTRTRLCNSPAPMHGGANCNGVLMEKQSCHSGINCPIHGKWGPWSEFSVCSVTCGVGMQERARLCDSPVPMYNGSPCEGEAFDFRLCNTNTFCPVDGRWSIWTQWSECSVKCGVGVRHRGRTCTNPAPLYGGLMCNGEIKQAQVCSTGIPCPVHGHWDLWSPWSDCSASCGEGMKRRVRICDSPGPQFGGLPCDGFSEETVFCKLKIPCPIHGEWDSWEPWTKCDGLCGTGQRARRRHCMAPAPQYGGEVCGGLKQELIECDTGVPCSVDGSWSSWSSWDLCIADCGMGYQTRVRACTDPEPMFGGKPCFGIFSDKRECDSNIHCPVHGNWSPWSNWDACDAKCGMGFQYRIRTCSEPKPLFGGRPCEGIPEQKRPCKSNLPCSVNGGWSMWSNWDYCDAKCGLGMQVRIRTCTDPRPMHGGQLCLGIPQEQRTCDTGRACTINGNWGLWSAWSLCDANCGYGQKFRSRQCDSPPAAHGGMPCAGFKKDYMECDTGLICSQKGGWAQWGMWSVCSTSCGAGMQIRQRSCTKPVPIGPGMDCDGFPEDSRICNTNFACPIHGQWSPWTVFGACVADCSLGPANARGFRIRERLCNNPMPQNGGMLCVGEAVDKQICMDFPPCLVPVWGLWSKWGPCSAVCGPGDTTRKRVCVNEVTGEPVSGCVGPVAEVLPCIKKACPLSVLNCSTECKWDNGIGYANYPGDCSLFVQCDSLHGNPQVHDCPWGLLWSLEILQCVFPEQSECNACTAIGEKIPYHISCSAYWLCTANAPVPMCCPDGHRFDPFVKECVLDKEGLCNEPCQRPEIYIPSKCTFRDSSLGSAWYEEETGGLWVTRPCGHGTVFSVKQCQCVHSSGQGFLGTPKRECKPELDLKFSTLKDDIARNTGLHVQGVKYLGDGTALFDGNAAINSNIFSNSEWGTDVYVYIRFKPDMKEGKQGLIHNSGCGPSDIGPSVFIGFDSDKQSIQNKNIYMKFATVPKKKNLQYDFVNMTVPSNQMLDAWFRFGKGQFNAEVNGLKAQLMLDSKFITGVSSQVARRHGALNIGGNLCKIGNEAFQGFKGILDEVRIYKCKPINRV